MKILTLILCLSCALPAWGESHQQSGPPQANLPFPKQLEGHVAKPQTNGAPANQGASPSDAPQGLTDSNIPDAPNIWGGSASATSKAPRPVAHTHNRLPLSTPPAPPTLDAKAYLLIDAQSGKVLAAHNAKVPYPPASLTKLMTLYVISSALHQGRIHLTDRVPISEKAWRTGGSRMFVQVGTSVPASQLIQGIIVASGNDATIAMAEFVGGSEGAFVDLMNQMAVRLGMQQTHYEDTTGLPSPHHYTTAFDLGILTRAIILHYPEDYKWYHQKRMSYNHIKQSNRNALLFTDPGVDGLKTGHTDAAGYCLVASGKKQDMRLIAIIMGAPSPKVSAQDAKKLLNYGFRFYKTRKLYDADRQITLAHVWFGANKHTALGLKKALYVTVPTGQSSTLKTRFSIPDKLQAPLIKGATYGTLQVLSHAKIIVQKPLIALGDNPRGNFVRRLWDHIRQL